MRQAYWKPQHEVFIHCMLKHEDSTKAYRTAYPKAKPASAREGGHRLFNYPHIRQRIEPLLRERKAEAHRKALEEGAERQRRQNERRMEMRHILYKVMMRQLKKKRNFIVNGQVVTIEDDPAIGTILNALTLDQRLEAGYDNWPVIEARFARIMASLLPREKRVQPSVSELVNANEKTLFHEQSVTISPANTIQAIAPAESVHATLLQKIAKTKALISNEEKNLLKCGDVADSETSGDFSLCSTTLRSDRNDALMGGNEQGNVAVLKRVQTVANLAEPPIPLKGERTITYSPFRGIGGKMQNTSYHGKRVQTVTISPTNPAQTHVTCDLKKARIHRAVAKTIWPQLKETG